MVSYLLDESKYALPLYGIVLSVGIIGYMMFSKKRALANAAESLRREEEQNAKRANSNLLSSPIYADLDNLRKQLEGPLILPTDGERYHECRRRAFNQNQRGFPLAVVRVKSVNDVAACVKFASKHQNHLNLCVFCGGHSSKCMMDNSFVIDLFYLNKAELDKENMSIKVEGGAYLEAIDNVLYPHNFGTTVGTYPQTGVGGLVLGGGFGFLARMCGWSVDNLLECEVVLQNGDVVIANDNVNQDLIWGLRGGSGNFGVVTKFVFRVHKLPTYCLAGAVAYLTPTLASAKKVAVNFDKIANGFPDESSGMLICPGGAPVSPTIWFYFGETNNPNEVETLRKGRQLGGWATISNTVKPVSYHKDLQLMTTPLVMSGHIYHTLIQFGTQDKLLPEVFWETLLSFTRAKLHKSLLKATAMMFPMGGKLVSLGAEGKTCVSESVRKCRWFCVIEAYWKPEYKEEGKNAARAWAHGVTAIIKPYCNEVLRYAAPDPTDLVEKDQVGYGNEKYAKLRALKTKYDPKNMFKNNVNITPLAQPDQSVPV